MKLIGFAPDQETTNPGVVLDGNLFYPTMRGIRALPVLQEASIGSLNGGVETSYIRRKANNNPEIIAQVGASKQWASDGSSWVDITGPAPGLSGFVEFGDVVIGHSPLFQMVSRTTGSFATIANSPIVDVLFSTENGFVVGANGYRPGNTTLTDQWFSSSQFDYLTWVPANNNTASDGRLFFPAGPITAGESLGQYAVLYKRNAIFVGQYTGPTRKWLWDAVPGSVGCIDKGSLIKAEGAHYFLGTDDFYRFDGTRPAPISRNIRKWLFEEKADSRFQNMRSAYDPKRKIIFWTWVSGGNYVGVCYSLITGEWGRADYQGYFVKNSENVQFIESGDGLLATDWDAGLLVFSVLGQLQYTDKTFGAAKVLAGDIGNEEVLVDLTRIRLRFAKPPSSGSADIHYRDTYTGESKQRSATLKTDRFDQTIKAGWIRPEMTLTGDWELLDISLPAPTRKQTIRANG